MQGGGAYADCIVGTCPQKRQRSLCSDKVHPNVPVWGPTPIKARDRSLVPLLGCRRLSYRVLFGCAPAMGIKG